MKLKGEQLRVHVLFIINIYLLHTGFDSCVYIHSICTHTCVHIHVGVYVHIHVHVHMRYEH